MLRGKWTKVNSRDRKKLKELVKKHGNLEVVANLIGVAELTLKKWMDKDYESTFRAGARDRIKKLSMEVIPAPVAEMAFQDLEVEERPNLVQTVNRLLKALNTVRDILEGPM